MLPLKWEQECGDAFRHSHQALVICTEQGNTEGKIPSKNTVMALSLKVSISKKILMLIESFFMTTQKIGHFYPTIIKELNGFI